MRKEMDESNNAEGTISQQSWKGKLKILLTGKGNIGSKTITVNVKPQGLKWRSKQ